MVAGPQTPTKSELLEALRSSGREVEERLGALPVERFEEGRYEGGWNGRGILAHIASIEWTYPRLLDIARGSSERTSRRAVSGRPRNGAGTGEGRADADRPRAASSRTTTGKSRSARTPPSQSCLTEFKTNRTATIAAVEAADEVVCSARRSARRAASPARSRA